MNINYAEAFIRKAAPILRRNESKLWKITQDLGMEPLISLHAIGTAYEQQVAQHINRLCFALADGKKENISEFLEEEMRRSFRTIRQLVGLSQLEEDKNNG